MSNRYVTRTRTSTHTVRRGAATTLPRNHVPFLYRKSSGQAMVIIVLSLFVLMAIVGLAIDGGSSYQQRRKAQNAADATAMAGTRKMLTLYEDMVLNYDRDVNGSSSKEDAIRAEINNIAAANGIVTTTDKLSAYFVNDQKQVVSALVGDGCGTAPGLGLVALGPCQVGYNNMVPWAMGAKGIYVTTASETDAFFMSLLGFNKVSANASATAFMGVAINMQGNIGLMPIGFFTETERLQQLQPGREYNLISGSTKRGSGNWGYVNFNGEGSSAPVVDAWIACGFNPAISSDAQWREWCVSQGYTPGFHPATEYRAQGPTRYWTGPTESEASFANYFDWTAGWWIGGSSGTTNSTCQEFQKLAPKMLGRNFLIPVFDQSNGRGGNNTRFHVIGLAWFEITSADIQCHKHDSLTPTPIDEHWGFNGKFINVYNAGATGSHGNIRHSSHHVVFLEP
ncbi:MAG: pilus assembly protein TadG-related protein [Chloroflexota bacterium]|nr:pilus assembly protein TadG-related protein [Chloroflexota bacterium]MDQ5866883.1 pilus assembly protein TadG-related protein [Chloroflexota bacterium]